MNFCFTDSVFGVDKFYLSDLVTRIKTFAGVFAAIKNAMTGTCPNMTFGVLYVYHTWAIYLIFSCAAKAKAPMKITAAKTIRINVLIPGIQAANACESPNMQAAQTISSIIIANAFFTPLSVSVH